MNRVAKERELVGRAIEQARDGLSTHIDELDRTLRSTLDIKKFASEHATELAVAGAVVGFLVGFGFPKTIKQIIQLSVPIVLGVYKIKLARDRATSGS
ncbi:MAG TPA: hypothetical protein VEZ11_02715 [Thermoanaerobaculia bacterium]|nr:hypothetical protein [Thermoanaerobaculia bacterium]